MNPKLIFNLLLAGMAAILLLPEISFAMDATNSISQPRCKIAVCDWMILKRQKLGALQLAKDRGMDGVEVDMGSLGERETFVNSLTNEANCKKFLDQARELNLEISSIAMSGFYAQSFAGRTNYLRLVQDCIGTMRAMDVKIAFLPLGVNSDLLAHPELHAEVVARLKAAGALAEKTGIVIGIETELDADAQIKLLDEINSPAVKIYFNLADAIQHQRDVVAELKKLGADRICEIHFSNKDGAWLQNDPQVDAPKIKSALDEMGWRGWPATERSRDANDVRNVKKNCGANVAYLKSVFQK